MKHVANNGTGLQPAFPGLGVKPVPVKRRRTRAPIVVAKRDADLLDEFGRRLRSRFSKATERQYVWVLKDLLKLAGALSGRAISLEQFFRDPDLIGKTLARGTDATESRMVSADLASQRRTVTQSFALLMNRELEEVGISNPSRKITDALQAAAEPIGTGYRIPAGCPRRRGGPMPSEEDIDGIRETLSDGADGWRGNRDTAFLGVMDSRGQRVGALLQLDGSNLHRLPDGQVHMLLHAKSSKEPFELVLPAEIAKQFEAYIAGFNEWAQAIGLPQRIGFGVPGPFWRGDSGEAWTYRAWSRELSEACLHAGIPRATSHGFRRAYATRAVTLVPRSIAALSSNWGNRRQMDDRYVHPSLTGLRKRLSNIGSDATSDSHRPKLPTSSKVG